MRVGLRAPSEDRKHKRDSRTSKRSSMFYDYPTIVDWSYPLLR